MYICVGWVYQMKFKSCNRRLTSVKTPVSRLESPIQQQKVFGVTNLFSFRLILCCPEPSVLPCNTSVYLGAKHDSPQTPAKESPVKVY